MSWLALYISAFMLGVECVLCGGAGLEKRDLAKEGRELTEFDLYVPVVTNEEGDRIYLICLVKHPRASVSVYQPTTRRS